MSVVGQFPGMSQITAAKRMVKSPVNPMDKSTIVSIYPQEVDEKKVTIQPGRFVIPPGSFEKPSVLIVGPSSWWREIDEQQPYLEISCSSVQVAEAVVKDYINGIIGCNMETHMPGLFYVPGCERDVEGNPSVPLTIKWIKEKYTKQLERARRFQLNWYAELVKQADGIWSRSNGNPLAISDQQRMAAREMNLQSTKDWMKDFQMVAMVRCKACGALKSPDYPVCASCHFPDPDHPMTQQLLAAKQSVPSQGTVK